MTDVLNDKCKKFAVRNRLCEFLQKNKKETTISNQLFRCGTSVGADVSESKYATSKADLKNKLQIALKEASETEYWLDLLKDTSILTQSDGDSIKSDCVEIIKCLLHL